MATKMDKEDLAMFETICHSLEKCNLKYDKNEDDLSVHVGIQGDGLPINLVIFPDTGTKTITMYAPLPLTFSADKRVEGAVVTSYANFILSDGGFDYEVTGGKTVFKMTSSYRESLIAPDVIGMMIAYALKILSDIGEKIYAVSKGFWSAGDFIEKVKD